MREHTEVMDKPAAPKSPEKVPTRAPDPQHAPKDRGPQDPRSKAEQHDREERTVEGAPKTTDGRRVRIEDIQTPEPARGTPEGDGPQEYPEERTAARQDREQREAGEAPRGLPPQGAVQEPPMSARVPRRGGEEEMPSLQATQAAKVGEKVILNAHQFHWGGIVPGDYGWRLVSPDGAAVALTNPHMPGPSFVPQVPGAYKAMIGTPHGEAVITVNVSA